MDELWGGGPDTLDPPPLIYATAQDDPVANKMPTKMQHLGILSSWVVVA
jgi:hypothetical protein